jgi:DNA-binding NarL/FixJ family response regulator
MKDLSPREQEVLRRVAEGSSNYKIAGELNISVRTVEGHRARVMLKLKLKSLAELIRYALQKHVIDP